MVDPQVQLGLQELQAYSVLKELRVLPVSVLQAQQVLLELLVQSV